MPRPVVIGSRGSKLALWQAEQARQRLRSIHPQLEINIEIIKTTGDVKSDPLSVIGGKGVFTKELEDALLDGRIDMAVHSLKDLPTILPDGLAISAICEREDARDALVLRADMRRSMLRCRVCQSVRLWARRVKDVCRSLRRCGAMLKLGICEATLIRGFENSTRGSMTR